MPFGNIDNEFVQPTSVSAAISLLIHCDYPSSNSANNLFHR